MEYRTIEDAFRDVKCLTGNSLTCRVSTIEREGLVYHCSYDGSCVFKSGLKGEYCSFKDVFKKILSKGSVKEF